MSTDEIANMFQRTQPKIIFCDSGSIQQVQEAIRQLDGVKNARIITVDCRLTGVWFVGDFLQPVVDEHLFV